MWPSPCLLLWQHDSHTEKPFPHKSHGRELGQILLANIFNFLRYLFLFHLGTTRA